MKILLVCLVINLNILSAIWNPTDNLKENGFENDAVLMELEQKVFEFVNNSWCSEEKAKVLLELVLTIKPAVCVEIGPFMGSSTLPMLVGLRYLGTGMAYVIDAWSNQAAIAGLSKDDPNAIWWRNLDMIAIKNKFKHTMSDWSLENYFQLLHMTSEEAISSIPAIDFLQIDGNFSEEGAFQDSRLYIPKVVPGGYVLISNVLAIVDTKPSKMKALWPIFDQCELVYEIDGGNTLLFRKN